LKRRKNPLPRRYILMAMKGRDMLKFLGGHKFAKRGRAKLFHSARAAHDAGIALVLKYPVLRSWKLKVYG